MEEAPAEHAKELTAARDLLMEGEYERAAQIYEAAAAVPGQSLEAGLGLARCRERLGAYDEAIDGLTALDASGSADWHRLLAKLLRLKGRYEETIVHSRAAIQINPSDAGARLILAETLELLGRREEAIEAYRWFDRQLVERAELPKDAAWVTAAAVGFVRYSILTETNVTRRTQHALHEMLQMAYQRLDRSWWPARIAAADLLRAKFNNDQEDGSVADYRAALRINPNLPEAFVGLGEVLLEGLNFEKVEHLVDSAQEINPNHPGAYHLLAEKLLREQRYAQVSHVCEQALAVNPRDLTALSLNAASYACRYDTAAVGRLRSRIDAINPHCATLHRILGDALAGIRQYAESQREYLAAIEADPTDANARTELGMMYMQWGREARAREVLEGAWALDAFNQRTKFTLDLLESLESFARFESAHFVIEYDAKQDPGLGPYLSDCLEKIYAEVTGDFNVSLEDRTIIELFPTKRAFGVRITGKPWIHTVGACTGRVIALTSPRRSPKLPGPYQIAQVLTHEFTHTVTLALTNNRIPHWFTEGLAVLQENAPRSFAWSQLLADAVRRDRLFTLESITWGFIRPRHPNDRTLAYAQSEWMCEYLIERLGYDVIENMLQQFRAGRTQDEVFRDQFANEPPEFDREFRHWARQQVADWGFDTEPPEDIEALRSLVRNDEDSAPLWGRLARAEYDSGMNERAQAAARRALELDENERNALNALAEVLLAYALQEEQETAKRTYENEALPVLRQLEVLQPDSWIAAKGLARIALRRGKRDLAIQPLERLQRVCPIDPLSWQGLAGIYLEREAYDLALPQLLELARTNATDKEIPRQIASIYKRKGRLRDAQYWYQQAAYIDPFDVDLHETLAETGTRIGDWTGALREYKMLISLQPSRAQHYEQAAVAARAMGDSKTAEAYAHRAMQLDPSTETHAPIKPRP